MKSLPLFLLAAGLVFPLLSLISALSILVRRQRGTPFRSPVFIPFVGPILLSAWVLLAGHSRWLLPAAWIVDVGTLYLLVLAPKLIAEGWRTSPFTTILALRGTQGDQCATLTLHAKGHYLLRKKWNRPQGQTGILQLGEPGTYTQCDNRFDLVSFMGLRRMLRKTKDGSFFVEEPNPVPPNAQSYSLKDWTLDA